MAEETLHKLNHFTIPVAEIPPEDAKLLLFGKFTPLPEDIELKVSQEAYTALNNLLGLLCIEKCTSQITSMTDSEAVLRDAALASQIILLEDILVNVTVS